MAGAIGRSSAGKRARIYIVKRGKGTRAWRALRGKAAPHIEIAAGSTQSDATSSCHPQDDAGNKGNYKTIAHYANYPMGHIPVSMSTSCFQSAPFSPSALYSPTAPLSLSAHFLLLDYNHMLAQFSDIFDPIESSSAPSEIEVGVTQEMADDIEVVKALTSRERLSVVPEVYLSAPQSPADSSVNLYSPMNSVPESWMVSSAVDVSSVQLDDNTPEPNTSKTPLPFTDTLHMILMGVPRWRNALVCLRLKMKVAICCGNVQNPFLIMQLGYAEQRKQFMNVLFEQSLTAVNLVHDDLENVVSHDGITTITTDEMLILATKWIAGFNSDLKRVAKLAIMDTRSVFGFGLNDTSAADPSLLANKCVELLRRFMVPQSTLLPISVNGLLWLLRNKIVKSLVFYIIFRPSSTSGARVVIGDEEPAIFRTAPLLPVEMIAYVLTIWYSTLLTRLSELVKAMKTSGLPVNIMMSIFPPVAFIYSEALECLLWLLEQTDDPAYPDFLQVLTNFCDIDQDDVCRIRFVSILHFHLSYRIAASTSTPRGRSTAFNDWTHKTQWAHLCKLLGDDPANITSIPDVQKHVITCFIGYLVTLPQSQLSDIPPDLWDLGPDSFLSVSNANIRVSYAQQPKQRLYIVESLSSTLVPWKLVVPDAITAVMCLRHDWGSDITKIACNLLEKVIAIKTLQPISVLPHARRPLTELRTYLLGHVLSPKDRRLPCFRPVYADYIMYEQHRHKFMNQPRARAALLHGGLIWRLALHSLGFDVLPSVLDGISREAVPFGLTLDINGQTYFDDELSEEEVDFMCGMYHVHTNDGNVEIVSWWPRPHAWAASGLNVGFWSS
ncbi:uncharacterized protein F5147DRAFT_781840 [Suillus discolor]|uniref:Uncharacterized protein n=1 Tax=Suillus discolor TaxID=1912936 RepID=A0A9P7JLR4_9AGAM|nr:uncharacterized protein F5147DRAFT_781840 [Suillus discolor]KAG2085881.1 hypothetical protein F5147DRAFT_781840 [Suillus discolor]